MAMIGYVDVEYADTYVAQHFVSTDALRSLWEGTSEEDKEVLLLRSFEQLELLPYTGRKYSKDQIESFPRRPDPNVPDVIKAAQVENAVAMANTALSEEDTFYDNMSRHGVTSYSIGNLSERLGRRTRKNATSLYSERATKLVSRFVSGGYDIRGLRR